MTSAGDLNTRAAVLSAKLKHVHGIGGRDLAQALTRARRVLPRRLCNAAPDFARAQAMIGHPKLEPMIDIARLTQLMSEIEARLDAVNVAEERKTGLIRVAARIASYVLFVLAAFVLWLVWAGHL